MKTKIDLGKGRPGNPLGALWPGMLAAVMGGATMGYMAPLLLKLFERKGLAMTVMEKAYTRLLIIVLQRVEDLDKENEELRQRPSLEDYKKLRDENTTIARKNGELVEELRKLRTAMIPTAPPMKKRRARR